MCGIVWFVQEIKIKIFLILQEIGLLDRVEYGGSDLFNYSYAGLSMVSVFLTDDKTI